LLGRGVYKREADYLEFTRDTGAGHFVELVNGIFGRVNEDGEMLGFAVLNLSSRKRREVSFDVTFERQSGEV
jgi:hypothetical protein